MSEFEKKSERIEIRVSHSKKQAFNAACEQGGDTPSGALRRFIDSYISRADGDALSYGMRALGRILKRQWFPIGVMTAMLLVGGYFTGKAFKPAPQDGPIVTASTEALPPINYTLFAAYDKNANGVLDLGEVAENDEHLHRVLDLDGVAGISPAEFYPKAKMQWHYFYTSSIERRTEENEHLVKDINNSVDEVTLVNFDLLNPEKRVLEIRAPNTISQYVKKDSGEKFLGLIPYVKKYQIRRNEIVDRSVNWIGCEHHDDFVGTSFSSPNFQSREVSNKVPS